MFAASYSSAVSRLLRPFLSDRYFLITVPLLRRRAKLSDPDLSLLARAFGWFGGKCILGALRQVGDIKGCAGGGAFQDTAG